MKYKKMTLYLLIIIIGYYLLPLVIKGTGIGMLVLLVALPIMCILCSFLYGFNNSFQLLFSLLVAVLFIPSVFIYYNSSAMIYAVVYGVLSLIGMLVGSGISKK